MVEKVSLQATHRLLLGVEILRAGLQETRHKGAALSKPFYECLPMFLQERPSHFLAEPVLCHCEKDVEDVLCLDFCNSPL